MHTMAKIMAGVALLTAIPTAITTLQNDGQGHTLPSQQRAAAAGQPFLASANAAPDHTRHSAGCGCAGCQACQAIARTTI